MIDKNNHRICLKGKKHNEKSKEARNSTSGKFVHNTNFNYSNQTIKLQKIKGCVYLNEYSCLSD